MIQEKYKYHIVKEKNMSKASIETNMRDYGLIYADFSEKKTKTLDEKIAELSMSKTTENLQVYNWLSQLKEYIEKDTPMEIKQGTLFGRYVCSKCNKLMRIGVEKGYCNECGQAIK